MRAVLFTQRIEIVESYHERRDCADQRIAEFIAACGYLPVPVPNNPLLLDEMVGFIKPDGMILTGGNSLVRYGGNAPERDETDKKLIDIALQRDIPLYGFCRGMQSILDYFDNPLVDVKNHVSIRHGISGNGGRYNVNSYHKQGCMELKSRELEAVFRSDDGVIEMIKHKDSPIIGTMWHPEREESFLDMDIMRVKELIG